MDFTNKVVLVTGASSGIGAAAAEEFAKLSALVVVVGRNEANLLRVRDLCERAKGRKALAIVADLSKDEDVERIINKTIETFDKLDVLVNNAGFGQRSVIGDGVGPYDRIMATNMRAVYLLTSLATPHLIKTKGNIVNVSSVASMRPMHGYMPYCVSKAALDMFTKCLSMELAPHGVRVNSVNPGATRTRFLNAVGLTDEEVEMMYKGIENSLPLKQVAESEEVADMVVYLAGDKAKSITGSFPIIDNGWIHH